jgi:hypothetical protein
MRKLDETERKRLTDAMMQVVDNQIRDNDPPQASQTLERLMAAGHSEEDARRMICGAVVEITVATLHGHEYDEERYFKLLARLPKLPWE